MLQIIGIIVLALLVEHFMGTLLGLVVLVTSFIYWLLDD